MFPGKAAYNCFVIILWQLLFPIQALDKDKKGYLTKDELIYYMTLEGVGEPLDTEEMEEMVLKKIHR